MDYCSIKGDTSKVVIQQCKLIINIYWPNNHTCIDKKQCRFSIYYWISKSTTYRYKLSILISKFFVSCEQIFLHSLGTPTLEITRLLWCSHSKLKNSHLTSLTCAYLWFGVGPTNIGYVFVFAQESFVYIFIGYGHSLGALDGAECWDA